MKNFLFIFLSCFCFAISNAYATPADCQTLPCVRQHIDELDKQIVVLIGKRLSYVKRAGELKRGKKPIYDPVRERKLLQIVSEQAMEAGYPPAIAVVIFKTILEQSLVYEHTSQ